MQTNNARALSKLLLTITQQRDEAASAFQQIVGVPKCTLLESPS